MNDGKYETSEPLKSNPSGSLALIDRAWDSIWALRVYCVVVFIDLALLKRTERGLLDWPGPGESVWQLAGYALTSIAVFGVLMSIGFPLLGGIFAWLSNLIPQERGPYDFISSEHRRPGQVRARELKEAALREENTFALARYEEAVRRREEDQRWDQQLGNLVLATLALSIVDGFYPFLYGSHGSSLVKAMFDFLGEPMSGIVLLLAVIASGQILRAAWFPERETVWIDYPQLSERLSQEERE